MSGSMRSRTISAGECAPAWVSASRPVGATLTTNPALRRYIATKEAIEASSSTTRTVCASADAIALLRMPEPPALTGGGRELEALALVRHRPVGAAVQRIGAVEEDALVRVARAVDPPVATAHGREVHLQRVQPDHEPPLVDDPEPDVHAGIDGRPVIEVPLRLRAADDDRRVRAERVGDRQLAAGEPTDDAAAHPDLHDSAPVLDGERAVRLRYARARSDARCRQRDDGSEQ